MKKTTKAAEPEEDLDEPLEFDYGSDEAGSSDEEEAEGSDEEGEGETEKPKVKMKKGTSTSMKRKGKKRKHNPAKSILSRINPGTGNLIKIGLVIVAGVLIYDYMTKGKLLGLFGTKTPLPKPDANATNTNTTPNTANPNTGTSPANAPASTTATTATDQLAAYLKSIQSVKNAPQQVEVAGVVAGGDTDRDLDAFNNDPRRRKGFLTAAANGQAYSIALMRKANQRFTWDEWNYYRAQGGTPIDIDALGLAPSRNQNIDIDTFIAKAGVDASQTGLGNLSGNDLSSMAWLT